MPGMKRESFPTSDGDPLPGALVRGFLFVLTLAVGASIYAIVTLS